jgi:xanthine dehydrogenase YagR molybdenum-binding subunit
MTRKRRIRIKQNGQAATLMTTAALTSAAAIATSAINSAQAQTNQEQATPSTPDGMKMLDMPHGILGAELTQIQRMVPVDEPPALPVNSELSVIGKRTPRIDAHHKVTGRARYTSDVRLPGMLYGRGIVSTYPHARLRSVDTSAAEKYPGVRAVYIFDTLMGYARERDPEHFNPQQVKTPGKLPLVRFVGQPIAAVAATTQAAADEAARLIRVDYEPLPFVCDMEAARKPDAPLIFSGATEQEGTGGGGGAIQGLPQRGNVRGPNTGGQFNGSRGDTQRGFAEADLIVEGEFKTQVQTHSQLETNAIVADWKSEGLTVYISTQGVSGVRDEIAEVFDLPKSKIRVICEYMGGGFGAKWGIGNYGRAAIELSRKTGAPVRIMLDRRAQHLAVGNRPSSVQQLRIGAKRDGTLTAIQLTSHGTAGVGLGAGVGNVAHSMYACPNFAQEQYDVFINAGPGAAFRAPGAPQGVFALEQLLDELAERIEIDPIALRDKIDANEMRRQQRRIGAERIGWTRRRPPGVGLEGSTGAIKRGIGFAQSEWSRYVDLNSSCEVRIMRDGSVEVRSSVQDLGTGVRTILAQVVAEELGLQPTDITVRIGDSMFPAGPGSGGSKTTPSITPAARNAAYRAKQQMLSSVASELKAQPSELAMREGRIFVTREPSSGMSFKEAAKRLRTEQISVTANRSDDYGGFERPVNNGNGVAFGKIGGVQFVEVAVDTEIGTIKLDRVVAVHDCGRPINPLQIESQINGGIIQGLSWALYEDRRLDTNHGIMLNANLEQYKIAGAREIPNIEVILLEEYQGRSSTDASGIAEPANIATAAAIANAFYNATGVRLRELPMAPKRVLSALATANRGT